MLNFNKSRRTDSPTPVSYSPTPTPALSRGLSPGDYRGSGTNTTYNQRGDFYLRIDSVDGSDSVKGYFEASNGLQGNGKVSGRIENGTMKVSGALTNGDGISIWGDPSGDSIVCTYTIATKSGFQKGEFTVNRR